MKAAPALREVGALSTLLLGAGAMLLVAHAHYPVQAWLVWRYLAYWLIGLGWVGACAGAGDRLLRDVLRVRRVPAADAALMALALGVLLFFWVLFAAGLLGCLTPTLAVGLPPVMLAVGGLSPWRRAWRLLRRALRTRARRPALLGVSSAFGVVALAMIYLTVSTPENVGFDAQWYHLPVAEHFAAGRRIGAFAEGWYLGAYPHLASVLYAWAFLLPGTQVFDRVLLAAHLEWFLFLATVFAVPLLVRRIVPRAPAGTWALMFLFPSIFLYDGGLFVGADHVLAFWVIPAYLALLRVERRLDAGNVVLLAAVLAGAILTKYQAMYVLLPIGVRLAWAARQGPSGTRLSGRLALALAVSCTLVLTSPHWLANVLWYGDPFFPALHAHLRVHPWSADATRDFAVFARAALWQPQGDWLEKALATARAVVVFSFEPHDWPTYHGSTPVFGSLFTVLSFATPFLAQSRRVLHLVMAASSGVALWFVTSHQDRYLQCLLPWMVAASAATLVQIARQMPRQRPALVLLLGVQFAWGADVYFIPAKDDSSENDRPSPVKAAVDLASSGYRGDYEPRLHPYAPWQDLGGSLPLSAKVLVHERYLHLGLGRMAMTDLPGWQSAISYARLATPRAIHDALRELGVTHVAWETEHSHEADTLAGDLAFFRFAAGGRVGAKRFGAFSVAALDDLDAADPSGAAEVARYDCPRGAGELRELLETDGAPPLRPLPALDPRAPPGAAGFIVVDRTCGAVRDLAGFALVLARGPYDVFARAPTADVAR